MSQLFWITYVLLWVVTLVLLFAVSMLLRYHGQRLARQQERDERRFDGLGTLADGEMFPEVELADTTGKTWQLPAKASATPTLMVFMVRGCKLCADAVPYLNKFAAEQSRTLSTLLIYSGKDASTLGFVGEHVPVLIDQRGALMKRLRIRRGPYGVLLDSDGVVVRGLGLVGESKFTDLVTGKTTEPMRNVS